MKTTFLNVGVLLTTLILLVQARPQLANEKRHANLEQRAYNVYDQPALENRYAYGGVGPAPVVRAIHPARCNQDNCLRHMLRFPASASGFCATYTASFNTATAIPDFGPRCHNNPAAVSSACSCFAPATSVGSPTASPTLVLTTGTTAPSTPSSVDVPTGTVGASPSTTFVASSGFGGTSSSPTPIVSPTYSAPYPVYNSTVTDGPTGPTGTGSPTTIATAA